MYEISLVPDVKAELLHKQKVRNLIILICIIVSISCGAVLAILGSLTLTQNAILVAKDTEATCRTSGSGGDIKSCDAKYGTAILNFENYEALLTMQDQMRNISLLNGERIKMSRLFPILDILLISGEDNIKASELSADMNEGTLYFDAQAYASNGIGYRAVEGFKKNAAESSFDYGDYMRKIEGTQDDYEKIPSFCITETTVDNLTFGIYHKGAPGCEAEMTSVDDENSSEASAQENKVEDIYIPRTYANRAEMSDAQNGNYANSKSEAIKKLNMKSGYYFESQCNGYDEEDNLDESMRLENCPLITEEVTVNDSTYGKDSDGQAVVSFSTTVYINIEMFKGSNNHMQIIGPTRMNVTDSYIQVRDMFTEKAEETKE